MSEFRAAVSYRCTSTFTQSLYNAAVHDRGRYMDRYNTADMAKNIANAQMHAVLDKAAEIYREGIVNTHSSSLAPLYAAFDTIYPGKYSYFRFARYMRLVCESGAESLVKDKRRGNNYKINDVVKKWLLDAMSSGKKYGATHIHRLISELCEEYGYKTPSLSWVKANYYKMMPLVYAQRNGNDEWTYKELPYAGITRASAPGGQWQIDGWRLPFYMSGYKTLTLFAVMDAHSGKIIGYHVDHTENTETILKGLENAVCNTGVLPQEIVSDNHSFNQTKEAENFKESLEKLGCIWTTTQNPRHKGIIERSFGTFGERHCKAMYGYVGQGIRTRRANGRTSQELIDKYTRSGAFLTEDQIKLIAIELVDEYNRTSAGNYMQSPDEKYTGKKNIGIPVDDMQQMILFIRKGLHKVKRGQINIERAGVVYEYQLDAKQYMKLNNKTVAVRYADYNRIYLFDAVTDKPLGSVPRKRFAHGAICDQTADDIEILNRNKGRLNGIKTAVKQRQDEIAYHAESIDPDAAYAMNAKLTPKNVIESMKEYGQQTREAHRMGVEPELVTNIPVFSEVNIPAPDRKKEKRGKESPFAPSGHKIKIIQNYKF